MTTNVNLKNTYLLAFGIPIALVLSIIAFVNSPFFDPLDPLISAAVTFDLLLTAPLIHFFLIRKKEIPKTTIVFFFIVGIITASFILPEQNQSLLDIAKYWVLPLIEISVFSLIGYKVYTIVQEFKAQKSTAPDAFVAIKRACQEILPGRLASVLAAEIGVYYYGFINWSKPTLQNNQFTYHTRNTLNSVLGSLIFIISIETVAVHILVSIWTTVIAWILTAISVYTIIQVFGIMKSLSRRPISLEEDMLVLRYGLMNEASIDLNNIESVEFSNELIKDNPDILPLSPLGELDGHNVLLFVKEESELIGFYGSSKKFSAIAFNVDDKEGFKTAIEQVLNKE